MAKWYDWLVSKMLASLEMTETEILELEIAEHMKSQKFETMVKASDYYRNRTAILEKVQKIEWKSNARLQMGLFKKMVDQKVGYLFSKAPTISHDDEKVQDLLATVFDDKTLKEIKSIGRETVVKGVAYAIPYYDEDGMIRLCKIPSQQIIPFWSDERFEQVDAFLRIYPQDVYKFGKKTQQTCVEYWTDEGIWEYILDKQGKLKENPAYEKQPRSHFYYQESPNKEPIGFNWERVPLVVFRYNEEEQSLLEQTKSLIDNLELQASTNADLLADIPKFIYILKNYGGEDLAQFLHHLNEYRSIKVKSDGGVDKLQADINTQAVEAEIVRSRKALYEAARAIDTQDENLGNASGQALKWRYIDLDLDCNDLENEFQQSILRFMWFVNQWALTKHSTEIDLNKFSYIFNRDIITNESEAIQDCQNSIGILDAQTIREQHPWYSDKVEERLSKEDTHSHVGGDNYVEEE